MLIFFTIISVLLMLAPMLTLFSLRPCERLSVTGKVCWLVGLVLLVYLYT